MKIILWNLLRLLDPMLWVRHIRGQKLIEAQNSGKLDRDLYGRGASS